MYEKATVAQISAEFQIARVGTNWSTSASASAVGRCDNSYVAARAITGAENQLGGSSETEEQRD